MSNEFKDRNVVVTGAGSGNGRAIAIAFAAAGARVVCADRNIAGAQETVDSIAAGGGEAIAVPADIIVAADCERVISSCNEKFGAVDVLVNNAGVSMRGGILDLSEADWDKQFAINVKGAFLMTRAAVANLRERKGTIVNIASIAGLRGSATHLAYSSSKHAVVGFTRSLALELASQGVRVNAVCPGLVDTPMIAYQGIETIKKRAETAYPMGRIGTPDEVAQVVLHLASRAASWTTGLCYVADGGTMLL